MTQDKYISYLDLLDLDWDISTDPEAVDPVSNLLQELDIATIEMLYFGGDSVKVWLAYCAVLNHPLSTWTEETLSYRQNQLHFK